MDGCHLSQNSETPLLRKTPQDKRAVTRRPQDPFAVLKRSLGNQATRDLLNTDALQAKPTVNQSDDVYEQEADHVAEQVMRTPDAAKPLVQRTATSQARDAAAPPVVHDVLSSPGQPLDPATRAFMEPRFSYDFGDVRVHTDTQAAESARAVNALAYTVGRDVVFGAGQYAPGTSTGQRLIAHELTHVLQQAVMARTSALHFDARNARGTRDSTVEAPLVRIGERHADTYSVPCHTLMRQTGDEQESANVQQPESAGFWGTIGGGLMGEFNEDPGFAMMGVDVGVSLIPILDQASDIRDILAHLYFMIFHNQHDRFMRWLGVVFTLIGLVPEVGSAIKGASKFVIKGVHEVLSHLEDLLLPVTRILPDIMDFGRLYRYVAANWNRWMTIGLGAWEQAIGRVMQVANAIPAFLNRHLRIIREGLDRVRQLAPAKLSEAFDWARRQWDEIVQFIKRPGDEELEQAFIRLERGETPQEGALLSDLLHHSQQDEALAELRRRSGTAMPGRPGRTPKGASINPQPGFQSAHTTPQSALRDLAQYDPGDMITRILPTGRGNPHTVFDQFWQEEFRQIRKRTGRTTTTASELHQVLERAARQSGAFSPAEAESVVGLIHEDLFVRLGLTENQVLRIPGT